MNLRDEIKLPLRCPQCNYQTLATVASLWSVSSYCCPGCRAWVSFEGALVHSEVEAHLSRALNEVDQKIRRLEDEIDRMSRAVREV